MTVIELLPAGSDDKLIVATPLLTIPTPMDNPPLKKVTAPLGTATPVAKTVAVRLTGLPNVGLLGEAARVVVVVGGPTFTIVTADVEVV